ncbi:MAG: glycosyltransferase family 4 protein [Gemmatimonadaceae bacterium]
MRILVVTHNYPRFAGDPAGAFVARLAAETARAGHEVRVVAPHTPGTALVESHDGVCVHRFRYAPERFERVGYRGDLHRRSVLTPLVALGVPLFLGAFAAAVRRAVRDFAPEVVHAHWWFPSGALAAASGVPYVVTCHGSDVRLLDRSALLRRLGRRVLRRAAAVTTVSAFLADDLRRVVPELGERLCVAPMPIDVPLFSSGLAVPKADPPQILYAGNLIPSKGVADLIRAVAILARRGVACRLKILGEGPALEELRAEAGAAGLDGHHVEWSRFLPQAAMPAQYGASTITVLPTRGHEEGLGLTLVEALLAGCAVVGTRAGGIPEVVIDGETGLLARGGDAGDLAEKLHRLLADGALRDRLAAQGRRRVESIYNAASATARFVDLYDAIANRRRAPRSA